MLYRVTSLAYDPQAGKAFYTADNYAFRDLMEVDVASGKSRMLLRDARIGDIALNPKDHALWGLRHPNGLVTLVRLDPLLRRLDAGPYVRLRGNPLRPGHLAGRDAALRLDGPGGRRPVGAGLPDRRPCRRAAGSGGAVQARGLDAGGLRLLARRQIPCSDRATIPGSRTSTATSWRPERSRRCRTLPQASSGRSCGRTAS